MTIDQSNKHFVIGDGNALAVGESIALHPGFNQSAGCCSISWPPALNWIEIPYRLTGLRIDCVNPSPRSDKDHPVLYHGSGAGLGAIGKFFGHPCAPQASDGLQVDLRQRRVALVAEIAAGHRPLSSCPVERILRAGLLGPKTRNDQGRSKCCNE